MTATPRLAEQVGNATCDNCGGSQVAAWCAECGQRKLSPRRPLRLVMTDAIGTIFALDGKVFRTVRDLFLKPGAVTRAFIEGKRERYSPTFRLFFFASVAFFFYLNALVDNGGGGIVDLPDGVEVSAAGTTEITVSGVEVQGEGDAIVLPEGGISMPGADRSPVLKQMEAVLNARLQAVAETCSQDNQACFKLFAAQFQWVLYGMAPLYGLFIALLMAWKRGYYAVDAIMLSLNNHTFLFLGAILSGLFALAGPLESGLSLAATAYLHYWMVAGFRRVYATRWQTAILMSLVLFIIWALVFTVSALLAMLAGVLLG